MVAMFVATLIAGSPIVDADTYRLANGLTVVLAPDPSVGSVVVHVRYDAGSDAGPAYLIERALADGSPNVPRGRVAHVLDGLGGWNNSTTATDHTSVFEQLPPGALDFVLFAEADRMASLGDKLAAMPAGQPELSRDRATTVESVHSIVWPAPSAPSMTQAQGPGMPVRDLAKDKLELARAGFRPDRAILVITGAFDAAKARARIDHDFGWIPNPSGPALPAPPPSLPLAQARSVQLVGTTSSVRVIAAARTDTAMSPAALDVELAARILAGGRSSRLYRRLVTMDQLATDVSVTVLPRAGGGEVHLSVDALDAASTPAIDQAITDELAKLTTGGVTAEELARAKTHATSELVTALEDLAFRADICAGWAAYGIADLRAVRARIDGVTVASVQASAQKWFARVAMVKVAP